MLLGLRGHGPAVSSADDPGLQASAPPQIPPPPPSYWSRPAQARTAAVARRVSASTESSPGSPAESAASTGSPPSSVASLAVPSVSSGASDKAASPKTASESSKEAALAAEPPHLALRETHERAEVSPPRPRPDNDNLRDQHLLMAFNPAQALVVSTGLGGGKSRRRAGDRSSATRTSTSSRSSTSSRTRSVSERTNDAPSVTHEPVVSPHSVAHAHATTPTLLATVIEIPPYGTALRYGIFEPPRELRSRLEFRVKNVASQDAWVVRPGRDEREKYLSRPLVSSDYRLQIVVQTWLPRLPKRILCFALTPASRQGIPALLIRGDPLSKRFAVESLDAGRQIARCKRLRNFRTWRGNLIEVSDWELKIHKSVDAALIVAITAVLEDLAVQLVN